MVEFPNAEFDLQQQIRFTGDTYRLPHVLLRPRIFPDGDKWCCLLGENLMEGVSGFGDTPEEACFAFNKAFWSGLTPDAQLAKVHEGSPS